ncbi:MAG: hypothetical protein BVN28_10115 [Nitrospira sp. ST-bin4]|jgi:Protein of unknown function (DUF3015)|nr:MAG: hypothetical protein BVN28_10115 [Nitrospira sp. ST-bin4]
MNIRFHWFMTLAILALLQSTGCTLKGTLNQITDTTSNVTGTTSGAAWWNEDGQITPAFKAAAFATINHKNLQQDISAGRGEYLNSMGDLLGVPEEHRLAFFTAAQAGYARAAEQHRETLLPFLQSTALVTAP